ncbi:MAG: hypothetical protein ABI333_08655 [bacterium]
MAWIQPDGDSRIVLYSRLDAEGLNVGPTVTASAAQVAERAEPHLVIMANQRIAIVWTERTVSRPSPQVKLSYFNEDDVAVLLEWTVHEDAEDDQTQPQIMRNFQNGFTVVLVENATSDGGFLRQQRFLADGSPMEGIKTMSPRGESYGTRLVARSTLEGFAVICWVRSTSAFTGRFGQVGDIIGEPVGDVYATEGGVLATCDIDESGAYVVAHAVPGPDGVTLVRTREYEPDGALVAERLREDLLPEIQARQLDIALLPDGGSWVLALLTEAHVERLLVLASGQDSPWSCPVAATSSITAVSLSKTSAHVVAGLGVQTGATTLLDTTILAPDSW